MSIFSILCIFLVGCNSGVSEINKKEQTNWIAYQNADLGIVFQYPQTLGQAIEYRDANGKLTVVRLQGEKNLPGDIEFSPSENEPTIRPCKDVLENGFPGKEVSFPSKCEMMSTENATFRIVEFHDPDFAEVISVQTSKGVWDFLTQDKNQDDNLINIVKTMRYLK